MSRRPRYPRLSVFLNNRLVGFLDREASGTIAFSYSPVWLDWDNALPASLSLPLAERRYVGAPVLAVFENLLPDNAAIRRRVAERVHAEGTDAYSLLSALGRDCVGALQFLPDGEEPDPLGRVRGVPLTEAGVARILGDLALNPLGLDGSPDFRISIAGAQEKTALLRWKKRWQKPLGTTPTTHILKPQIGKLPNDLDLSASVENEYLCLKITGALGLPSADARIISFRGRKTLVVERFDRLQTRDDRLLRVPQEDCCQALSVPPTQRYESEGGPGIVEILTLLKGSDDPLRDQHLFLKATVVFWLLGAADGHAKNFSIFLSPGGRFRLTPLYDVISTQPNVDARQLRRNQMKLAMAVGNTRHYRVDTIRPRHFAETAAKAGVGAGVLHSIFDDLAKDGAKAVETVVADLPDGFPPHLADSVAAGFGARLRLIQ